MKITDDRLSSNLTYKLLPTHFSSKYCSSFPTAALIHISTSVVFTSSPGFFLSAHPYPSLIDILHTLSNEWQQVRQFQPSLVAIKDASKVALFKELIKDMAVQPEIMVGPGNWVACIIILK